jgi:hypothetical protein
MPVPRKYDVTLAGRGFMLVRTNYAARAWQRTGEVDAPGSRSTTDSQWGALRDEIDHPEVWDDWSGGYGHAYRRQEQPNTYHWSENADLRFPNQIIHCLQPQLAPTASLNINVQGFADVPLVGVSAPPAGAGTVLVYG